MFFENPPVAQHYATVASEHAPRNWANMRAERDSAQTVAPRSQDANSRRSAMSEGAGQVDPTRLSVEQAAKLLSAAYRERIDAEKIRLDLEDGAPVNADGTINLVNYSAWQAKEMGRGE